MANIGSLKARLEKLEAAAGIRSGGFVVLVRTFTGGELRGISGAGTTYWQRKAGESEEALRQRAEAEAEAPTLGGFAVLIEDREAPNPPGWPTASQPTG